MERSGPSVRNGPLPGRFRSHPQDPQPFALEELVATFESIALAAGAAGEDAGAGEGGTAASSVLSQARTDTHERRHEGPMAHPLAPSKEPPSRNK